jgi:hypothetical protein
MYICLLHACKSMVVYMNCGSCSCNLDNVYMWFAVVGLDCFVCLAF